ncbi:hypothetical protein [Tenacibaculum aestuarii]|uniref:hypothetical protein n=1 Tax=Tenacibaculum aestuarii TaxID=362781 RepID=UPI0038960E71
MYLKTILLFLLITLTGAKVPKEFSARVIGAVDGDTVKVLYQNKPIQIRNLVTTKSNSSLGIQNGKKE